MSNSTSDSAKLAAVRDLLHLLADRKKDDAPGIMDKAFLNSSLGLIAEVIGSASPESRPIAEPTAFGTSLQNRKANAEESTKGDTVMSEVGHQNESSKVNANEQLSTIAPRTPLKLKFGSKVGTGRGLGAESTAGNTPFVFGSTKEKMNPLEPKRSTECVQLLLRWGKEPDVWGGLSR